MRNFDSSRGHVSKAVLAVAMAVACAPAPTTRETSVVRAGNLRAEVDSLNRAMVAAFDSSPARVARFYSDSARIVGPRRSTVRGRTAIDSYWASIPESATWTLEVVSVAGSHDDVHQVGVSRLTSPRRDGTPSTYECDFVVLWKRQPDGTLRIMLDLYN